MGAGADAGADASAGVGERGVMICVSVDGLVDCALVPIDRRAFCLRLRSSLCVNLCGVSVSTSAGCVAMRGLGDEVGGMGNVEGGEMATDGGAGVRGRFPRTTSHTSPADISSRPNVFDQLLLTTYVFESL
jgi:hypothetical protein